MQTQQTMEERLWGFIDGTANSAEKSVIEKLLETDAAWKSKYHELLDLNEMLHSSELEEPSLRFTKNVMEEISRLQITPAAKSYINKKIIWSIGFFFIAMVVGFLIYGFGQMFLSPSGEESEIAKTVSKIDFSKFFNNSIINGLMLVNVVLGLFLLDNYLSNKRKQYRKEA